MGQEIRKLTYVGAAAFAAIALSSSFARAAPIYELDHFRDTFNSTVHAPGGNVGPQGTPIDYDFAFQSVHFLDRNFGEVRANVNAGSIGIAARAFNNGQFAPQRQEVFASFTFDVVFGSAGNSPIDVVMNLDLSGSIDPGPLFSTLQVRAGLPSNFSSGSYSENNDPTSGSPFRDGMLSGFTANGATQSISTGILNVPVNVPVTMFMRLNTIQGYQLDDPRILFGDTMSLTTTGDVFTILGPNADGITVNSADAGIVDNRFGQTDLGIDVPEPGTLTLLSAGLVSLGWARRRRSVRP